MNLFSERNIWFIVGAVLGLLMITLFAVLTIEPPLNENGEPWSRELEGTRDASIRVHDIINKYIIYTKDDRTDVCFTSYRSGDNLATVPCTEKVLDLIRQQRRGNGPR